MYRQKKPVTVGEGEESVFPSHGLSGKGCPQVPKKILFIMHEERTCSGSVGQWFSQRGYQIEIRKPRWGDALPQSLECYQGVIVFGGNMSVNDPHDYIRTEIEWLGIPLREKVPVLGICLGAQLLVRHLGGKVQARKDGLVEAGYYPVSPAEKSVVTNPAMFPGMVYEWHSEGFGLPAGMTCFLRGQNFENQAVLYEDCHVGLQFHPEVTERILRRWITLLPDMLQQQGSQSASGQIEKHLAYQSQYRKWLDAFLMAWCSRTVGL